MTKKKSEINTEIIQDSSIEIEAIAETEEILSNPEENSQSENAKPKVASPKKTARTKSESATQTIVFAGPKEKKALRSGKIEEEAILSISGTLRAKTESRTDDQALLELRQSQAGAIMTGTVSSVESIKGMGGAVAVVYHEGYKIVIPAKLFKGFPPYDETLGYENEEHMHLAIMRKHLMAEIDYKIYPNPNSINPKERVAIASRIAALKEKRKRYWIEKNKYGKTIIHNGSIVEARVINVPYTCAIVEIQGVEFKIPKNELSYMMVKDAGSVVKPGDIILAYIDDIHIDEQGRVTAFVSHKKTQSNPQERSLMHLSENSMCVGKVTAMTASSIYVVLEQGAEIRCNPPAMVRLPAVGDRVRVKVLYIDMPKLRATGEIFAVL